MKSHPTPFTNDVITDVQDHSIDRGDVVALVHRRLELVGAKKITLQRRTTTDAGTE